jgi:chorismate dehydratase
LSSGESTIAAVSFLNAKPLVHGLEKEPGVHVVTDVPSKLLRTLVEDQADVALCPVIDFQTSPVDLSIVPVGGIGSDGATHTVRVFSRRPIEEIERVHTDGDSHTSVALLTVVLEALHGRRPELFKLGRGPFENASYPEALLLIGDKVVRDDPGTESYPHQLDLGEAWKELTGLPFVFACWMARADRDLHDLPGILAENWARNRNRIPEIADIHADGWPRDLARHYLENVLRYDIGNRELDSIEIFWSRCHELGFFRQLRQLKLYSTPDS